MTVQRYKKRINFKGLHMKSNTATVNSQGRTNQQQNGSIKRMNVRKLSVLRVTDRRAKHGDICHGYFLMEASHEGIRCYIRIKRWILPN